MAESEVSGGDMMVGAYVGFLHWAVAEPHVLVDFKKATGLSFQVAPRSGLEALIDAACNMKITDENEKVVLVFILWVTEHMWGDDMAPTFYFELKKSVNS